MELSIHTFLCGHTVTNILLKYLFALAFIEPKLAKWQFYRHFVDICILVLGSKLILQSMNSIGSRTGALAYPWLGF